MDNLATSFAIRGRKLSDGEKDIEHKYEYQSVEPDMKMHVNRTTAFT